ncbi:hypothetical protein LR48_Vigan617s000200 [Vigna angularis]|uniref:Uncharacterized protein n=1 Tax=Phaseolus angularis TaxID=3914 RepID=A0A0L9TED0_PHAAN|nr:hypothetical protein LR48_Vigan617s000200 [Vigna angularis]
MPISVGQFVVDKSFDANDYRRSLPFGNYRGSKAFGNYRRAKAFVLPESNTHTSKIQAFTDSFNRFLRIYILQHVLLIQFQ